MLTITIEKVFNVLGFKVRAKKQCTSTQKINRLIVFCFAMGIVYLSIPFVIASLLVVVDGIARIFFDSSDMIYVNKNSLELFINSLKNTMNFLYFWL